MVPMWKNNFLEDICDLESMIGSIQLVNINPGKGVLLRTIKVQYKTNLRIFHFYLQLIFNQIKAILVLSILRPTQIF